MCFPPICSLCTASYNFILHCYILKESKCWLRINCIWRIVIPHILYSHRRVRWPLVYPSQWSLHRPQRTSLSQLHLSLSSFIIFTSHQILSNNLPWLPHLLPEQSYTVPVYYSMPLLCQGPCHYSPLPLFLGKESKNIYLQINDHSKASAAHWVLLKAACSSVSSDASSMVQTLEGQALIENNRK